MDYGLFEEALVDFFCRQDHDVAVARSRAAAIIHIAQGCDEQIVGGDRGIEMVCPRIITIAPTIEVEEADVALDTLAKFNQERQRLTVDLDAPENSGGRWLRKPRRRNPEK
jgi:hypothetical protein